MSKEKNESETEVSVSSLEQAIRSYRREDVLNLLKKDVLKQVPSEDKQDIYLKIAGLRSLDLIDYIVKDEGGLGAADISLDTTNLGNRTFIQEVLKKYRKSLKLNDAEEAEKVFELACASHDTATIKYMIKADLAKDSWNGISVLPPDSFAEVVKSSKQKLEASDPAALYEAAAKSPYAEDKFRALSDAGYDFSRKNESGQTISDILKKELSSGKQPKNQEEKIRREQIRRVYAILNPRPAEPKEKKPMEKGQKILIGIIAAAAAVIVIVLVALYGPSSGNGTEDSAAVSAETSSDASASDASEDTASVASETEDSSSGTALATDTSLTVADGDTVNIDYTGYMDGEAFDGGSTNGAGTDLVIGSGSYIDDFEEQLIGHHPGDEVDVNVTFPDDYGATDLAGKDATFKVTINGIYESESS